MSLASFIAYMPTVTQYKSNQRGKLTPTSMENPLQPPWKTDSNQHGKPTPNSAGDHRKLGRVIKYDSICRRNIRDCYVGTTVLSNLF